MSLRRLVVEGSRRRSGTNENTNLLIRDFYPKGADFTDGSDESIREAQENNLNTRIHKSPDWKTAAATLDIYIGVALTN